MPEKNYFLKLTGAFLLGLIALIVAGIVFFLLIPFFIPLAVILSLGFMAVLIFILLWIFVYAVMFLGVALYYLSKPMKVKKTGSYTIKKAKESGRRQKGRTK